MSKRAFFPAQMPSLKSLALTVLGALALLWAAWVSQAILENQTPIIVRVDMAGLMREFVQNEARSGANPEESKKAIALYLAATEETLSSLEADGKHILVSEAVLSKNTRDATAEVRAAIARKLNAKPAEAQQ